VAYLFCSLVCASFFECRGVVAKTTGVISGQRHHSRLSKIPTVPA
jgi:hypothetical protein